ncbi:molybdenum cofactor biosynthesis protein, partial [Salmonella enterica subsp. salamae]|nr:molybdenum cofactor biosynthesis protein [Salmonella enterica subsp. salamae]EEB4270915.1 molybdenum cofactor biosynthesis protein [Salmonella enterica subsp. enterica serovar Typhimurium]
MSQVSAEFIPTRIAILTVSSRRGEEDDTSGHYLRDSAQEAGHEVVAKAIVKENRYAIRAQVSAWIASDEVQVVLITGGTGLTEGDQAPEALLPLFDR